MAKKQQQQAGASSTVTVDPSRAVLIEVPTRPLVNGERRYAPRSLNDLSGPRAETLRAVADGLMADGAEYMPGRPVENSDHALAWLLDRVRRSLLEAQHGNPDQQ